MNSCRLGKYFTIKKPLQLPITFLKEYIQDCIALLAPESSGLKYQLCLVDVPLIPWVRHLLQHSQAQVLVPYINPAGPRVVPAQPCSKRKPCAKSNVSGGTLLKSELAVLDAPRTWKHLQFCDASLFPFPQCFPCLLGSQKGRRLHLATLPPPLSSRFPLRTFCPFCHFHLF